MAVAADLCLFYYPAWAVCVRINHILDPQRKYPARLQSHLERLKIAVEKTGLAPPNARLTLRRLGHLYLRLGRTNEAEPLFLKLFEWQLQQHGPNAFEIVPALQDVASCYSTANQAEGIKYSMELLRLTESHHGPTSSQAGKVHFSLAWKYRKQKQFDMAERHFERVCEIRRVQTPLPLSRPSQAQALMPVTTALNDSSTQ